MKPRDFPKLTLNTDQLTIAHRKIICNNSALKKTPTLKVRKVHNDIFNILGNKRASIGIIPMGNK